MDRTRESSRYTVSNLLERAGTVLVGRNRANCPVCGGRRTVSYSEEAYCCHHAGCDFRGNAITLARQLGLAPRLPRAQVLAYRREREEASAAVECALQRIRVERQSLRESWRTLASIRDRAERRLRSIPEDATAWAALAFVSRELPKTEAALTVLQDAPVAVRLAFLKATEAERAEVVAHVILAGGLYDAEGRFIEVRY